MPLTWNPDRNPYRFNYFRMMRLGPDATPCQIAAAERSLKQQLAGGRRIEIDGQALDAQAVSSAAANLRNGQTAVAEMLLLHLTAKAPVGGEG